MLYFEKASHEERAKVVGKSCGSKLYGDYGVPSGYLIAGYYDI